jgi:uncharacterized protein YqgV (UPF0045/DUF77 family)
MKHSINLGIQVLPLNYTGDKYAIIDKAIEVIQTSGLKYKVCPFETVIEGNSDEIYALLPKIEYACHLNGAHEYIINIRLHRDYSKDLTIEDKIGKYEI